MTESIRVDAFGDVARFDPLIVSLRALLASHPTVPPGNVMLRVAMGMATALSRRGSDRAEIALWQARARAAARDVPGGGKSELVGFMFAISDFHDANFAAACAALDALPDPLTLDAFPFAQASGLIAHAMARMYRHNLDDCAAFVELALRRLETQGYILWLPLLAGLAANDACRRGDVAAAEAWLRRTAVYADRVSPNRGAHYHLAAAHYHIKIGDLAAARVHAETAIALATETGWLMFEAFGRMLRAEVLIEARALNDAEAELLRLDDVLARSATQMTAFGAGLLKADLRFARWDEPGAMQALAAAMALGRRQGARRVSLNSVRVARLFGRAFTAQIEPEFARAFLRAAEVPPPDPDAEAWPWPLKIVTFGGLAIETNGEPLAFARKTPKRLIMLLKAIVSYGGESVPEEKLIDAVWPDEDGDAGKSALTIAIHRLRKLLGDPAVIVVKDARVGLDPTRCWLDVWSFERRLASRRAGETEAEWMVRVEEGRALYRGDFLAGDDDIWWIAERRERLRQRFARLAPAFAD